MSCRWAQVAVAVQLAPLVPRASAAAVVEELLDNRCGDVNSTKPSCPSAMSGGFPLRNSGLQAVWVPGAVAAVVGHRAVSLALVVLALEWGSASSLWSRALC